MSEPASPPTVSPATPPTAGARARSALPPGSGPADPRGGAGHIDAFDRRLLAPMVLGAILNPVNSSIIAVALTPIGLAFAAAPSATAWLVSGLYLATAVGQPVAGRLVDQHGPRRLFLAGSALVGAGGLLGALAPSLGVLVAARVLLGLGTCAGYPAAMHLIRSEGRRTGRDSPQSVLTVLAISTQTIAVIGPTLGGLLIGLGGWRATLALNVPLAAASLALGALRLPTDHQPGAVRSDPEDHTTPVGGDALDIRDARASAARRLTGGLDVPGVALFVATLVLLLLFLLHPASGRWWLPVLSTAGATALAAWELRTKNPFLDLRVLAGNPPLLISYVRGFLSACVSYVFLYGYTQWLEDSRHLSASTAGLVLIPVFATGIAVSALTGRRRQVRGKLVAGALAQAVVALLLLRVAASSAIWLLVVIAVVNGIPQGLNNLAVQNAVYFQADPEKTASSAGLLRTFLYLGAIAASAANGLFFPAHADTSGMHHLALLMLTAALALLALTLGDRSLPRIGTLSAPASPAATTATSGRPSR